MPAALPPEVNSTTAPENAAEHTAAPEQDGAEPVALRRIVELEHQLAHQHTEAIAAQQMAESIADQQAATIAALTQKLQAAQTRCGQQSDELQTYKAAIASLQDELTTVQRQQRQQRSEHQQIVAAVTDRDATIARLTQQIETAELRCSTQASQIETQQMTLASQARSLTTLQEQVQHFQHQIEQQQQTATFEQQQFQQQVITQEQMMTDLHHRVQQLQHDLQRQRAEHQRAEHTTAQQTQAIARLNQQLQWLQEQLSEKTSECILRQRDYAAIAQESRQHQERAEQLEREMARLRTLANLAESHLNRWQAKTFTRLPRF